jgi:hypothetical protein
MRWHDKSLSPYVLHAIQANSTIIGLSNLVEVPQASLVLNV